MTPAIQNAFVSAQKLKLSYFGLQHPDGTVARRIKKLNTPEKIAEFQEYLLAIPPGPYVIVCRASSRDALIKYPVNTVNANLSSAPKEKQNVPEMVPKTHKDVDPEKYGKLQAQLEYQEIQIADLQKENADLRTMITELEATIEELETETDELQEPAPVEPMTQILAGLQPVIPVLAESVVDWLKGKTAQPAPQQPVVDLKALAAEIIRQTEQAQQQNGMQNE